MEYKLYTLVDITQTGQYRNEHGKEADRWKEQNFQTVLQILGIRANIGYATAALEGLGGPPSYRPRGDGSRRARWALATEGLAFPTAGVGAVLQAGF